MMKSTEVAPPRYRVKPPRFIVLALLLHLLTTAAAWWLISTLAWLWLLGVNFGIPMVESAQLFW